jgi:hypothetical protein
LFVVGSQPASSLGGGLRNYLTALNSREKA